MCVVICSIAIWKLFGEYQKNQKSKIMAVKSHTIPEYWKLKKLITKYNTCEKNLCLEINKIEKIFARFKYNLISTKI